MSIGKRIKELRTYLKITAAELANKLSIPVRTIGSYEREEAQPGSKFINALIEYCNVNANWLLTGKGAMFLSEKTEADLNYIAALKNIHELTDEEVGGLIDILIQKQAEKCCLNLYK